ncbi:dihydrolipoyl dehydrogenase [Litoribacter populi]|uniref:dihydrolipoyl dehydrogenase n=1 Tax=Litoribacter populi TaxID=2598460 RepID=UPI00117E8264|nr:dihydrolipoyl dehydrogenase [Litoribacter populi]
MSNTEKKQLIILGAGPGGYAAAFRAADLGIKVTLIGEEQNPGGVCLYRGCIPSKALLHVSKMKQDAEGFGKMGLGFKSPKIDLKQINSWKTGIVEKLTGGLGELAKAHKIEYLQGKAKFLSEKEIEFTDSDGKTESLHFDNLILATGSTPISLPKVEMDGKNIISSKEALNMEKIPDSLLVIGGGYIGLELGSVYAHLGSKVSIAEMWDGFLPGADRDLVEVFTAANPDLFEATHFNTTVESATTKSGKVMVLMKNSEGKQEKTFEQVLLAIGRKPNSEILQLEKAGIDVEDKGFVKVNEKQQTHIKHIYAIGDLVGEPMLAHKATKQGRIAAEVISGDAGAAYDARAIPAVVFTNPEIAWCGLTETEAKNADKKVKVAKFPWSASGRALTMGLDKGLTKLIIDPKTGRILGGGAAGKDVSSLIPEIVLAIEMGATAEDLSLTIHPHPTLSETVMEAAEMFLGSPTHLFRQK